MPESVNNPIILREILRYRKTHLLLLLLVFTASLLTFRFVLLEYSAATTVVVIDGLRNENKSAERNAPDFLLSTDQFNRIYQVVYSNEMYDHLIRNFSLFDHYHIDSTQPSAYAGAVDRLSASVNIKKTPYNAAVITVHDQDRETAVAMANEIALYADTLNATWLLRIQEKRRAVYQSTLDELEQRISGYQLKVDELLTRLSGNSKDEKVNGDLRRTVNALTATLETFRIESRQLVFALQTLQKRNYPTVWQQERALPERASLLLPSLIWSAGIAMLFIILTILFHYFRLEVSRPLAELISKETGIKA
ncbi:MAG: hypothetical protein RL021_390 [Bacteroidota bacterium]|jgi:hypothetical protein